MALVSKNVVMGPDLRQDDENMTSPYAGTGI